MAKWLFNKLRPKWFLGDDDLGGGLDPTKINGITKAEELTWTENAGDTDWFTKVSPKYWTAENPTLIDLHPYLVAYWKGEDLTDEINSHTLTNVGSATFTSGKHNDAFTLNGSSQYFTFTANDDFRFSGDFTISLWVKHSSITGQQTYISSTFGPDPNGLYIYKNPSHELAIYTDDVILNGGSISNATWHHLVITRIGTTMQLYIDNSSVDSGTISTNFSTSLVAIGDSPSTSSGEMIGQIDEPFIMKGHGMTTTEVTALYKLGTGAFLV